MGTALGKEDEGQIPRQLDAVTESEQTDQRKSNAVAAESEEFHRAPQRQTLHMRKESKEFLNTMHSYLDCKRKLEALAGKVDPCRTLHGMTLYTHSGGIREADGTYKATYRQQNQSGNPVRDSEELLQAATVTRPLFLALMQQLASQIMQKRQDLRRDGAQFKALVELPLKDWSRIVEKSRDDYAKRTPGPPEAWLYDLNRASVLCPDVATMDAVVTWLYKNTYIVTAKNRFHRPTISGYRDLLFVLRIPVRPTDQQGGTGSPANPVLFFHMCELQVHHEQIWQLSKTLETHRLYRYFRSYFCGNDEASVGKLMTELVEIEDSGKLDTMVVQRVLESDDVPRIRKLTELFQHLPEHDFALLLSQRALDIHVAAEPDAPSHSKHETHHSHRINVAESYNHIGDILLAKGEYLSALTHYRQALDIYLQTLGPQHVQTAATHNAIGLVLSNQASYDEALIHFEKALAIFSAPGGDSSSNNTDQSIAKNAHPQAATAWIYIGHIAQARGNLEQARENYEKARAIASALEEQLYGTKQTLLATTETNLGIVSYHQGDLDDALVHMQQALATRQAVLGRKHRQTGLVHEALGTIWRDLGNLEAAAEHFRQANSIDQGTTCDWERSLLKKRLHWSTGGLSIDEKVSRTSTEELP